MVNYCILLWQILKVFYIKGEKSSSTGSIFNSSTRLQSSTRSGFYQKLCPCGKWHNNAHDGCTYGTTWLEGQNYQCWDSILIWRFKGRNLHDNFQCTWRIQRKRFKRQVCTIKKVYIWTSISCLGLVEKLHYISVTGYAIYLNGCLIAWKSKSQRCVTLSSLDAE